MERRSRRYDAGVSYDVLILKVIEHPERPLGAFAELRSNVERALGVDLRHGVQKVAGVDLDLTLDVAGSVLNAVTVVPGGEGWEVAVAGLAAALGGVVLDLQTGREPGAAEPGFPATASEYRLELVSLDAGAAIGTPGEVWAQLETALGVTAEHPLTGGDDWSLRIGLVRGGGGDVTLIAVRAQWRDEAARSALTRRFVATADALGLVPFDRERNDTVPDP